MTENRLPPSPSSEVEAESFHGRTAPWPTSVLLLAAAAIALRLILFLGRGHYLAFDEGWYLLLARSLFTGDGYSLVGIPHITLSPLFPLLAGAAGEMAGSWVWGGRIVAALASGLLVLPAWSTFRRLGSENVAFIGALLVAVIPSMAPFVVPFWIGADLWVGAEPLLHLGVYTGISLWLWGLASQRAAVWGLAGAALGLAFLARPEAIVVWGLAGLFSLGTAVFRRSSRRLTGAALMGVGFLVVASPYWLYINQVTDQWALTGRGVHPVATVVGAAAGEAHARSSSNVIERMLWADDQAYERYLYGLDPSGVRLRSDYWGVQPASTIPTEDVPEEASAPPLPTGAADIPRDGPSKLVLFLRSLGQILPLFLWPFVFLGLFRPRQRGTPELEAAAGVALVGTSVAIAFLVAVDPRTQLFLVPFLALYGARGFTLLDEILRERVSGAELRPSFLKGLFVAASVIWMLGIHGQRLYRSLVYGSPHHVVAAQNRAVAEELDSLTDAADGPVASWHPSIAVYADRDWRVLPFATLPEIIRYAQAAGAGVVVLSAYYPPPLGVENLNTRYLVLPVPDPDDERAWTVRIERGDSIRSLGALDPVSPGGQ